MFDKDKLGMAIRACDYLLAEGGDFDANDAANLERFQYDLIDLLEGRAIACYLTFYDVKDLLEDRSPEGRQATDAEVLAVIKRARDEYYRLEGINGKVLNDCWFRLRKEAAKQQA